MYNFCRFRWGSHKLPIESGKCLSIDRSERLCTLCIKLELGDEFYYLFNCTYFLHERCRFLPKRFTDCRNTFSYCALMICKDKFTMIGFAKFIKLVRSTFLWHSLSPCCVSFIVCYCFVLLCSMWTSEIKKLKKKQLSK